jgi:hypothetical protein
MAITIDPQDSRVYRGANTLLFPSDSAGRASAFLSGLDVSDNVVFASFTADRRLRVDASVTIDNVDIGDVNTRLKVGGVEHYWDGVLNPDSISYAGFVQDQRMTFTAQDELHTLSRVADSTGTIINPGTDESLQEIVALLTAPLPGVNGAPHHSFGEVVAVASGIPTDVVTYTVPAGKTLYLRHVAFSGSNVSTFWIDIDGSVQARKRTYFTEYNGDFFFEGDSGHGLKVNAGQTITVVAEHSRPSLGDFDASMDGRLI